MPPKPCENVESIKNSTRNSGRDAQHQQKYPQLKQFYSLTEIFWYNYNYRHRLHIPKSPILDHVIAKAPQDLQAYKIYNHDVF